MCTCTCTDAYSIVHTHFSIAEMAFDAFWPLLHDGHVHLDHSTLETLNPLNPVESP